MFVKNTLYNKQSKYKEENKMLTLYIYINEKFKTKAETNSNNKRLSLKDREYMQLFRDIENNLYNNINNSFIIHEPEVLDVLANITLGYEKITIYLNSRILYGSKWGKFREQNKSEFIKAVKHAKIILEEAIEENKC